MYITKEKFDELCQLHGFEAGNAEHACDFVSELLLADAEAAEAILRNTYEAAQKARAAAHEAEAAAVYIHTENFAN